MKKELTIKQWAFKNRIKSVPKKLMIFSTPYDAENFFERFLKPIFGKIKT